MITIPQGVAVQISGCKVSVKGPKGHVEKEFSSLVSMKNSGSQFEAEGAKCMVNTVEGIVSNMVKGVTEGYHKELKIIYAHFPISIEVKGKELVIKNFQGEKQPRRSDIVGDTKIVVKGQSVTIDGADKHAVGQTLANMKAAMKIKDKDSRIFQDGVYEIA